MLFFRERPDEVFHDIVREALVWLKKDLTHGETDPHMMTAVLPKTATVLTLGPALATVDELLEALDGVQMFELTPMHRLILSEALERYCESYNNRPQDTDVHARYEIHQLDGRRMHTIFLAPFDAAMQEAPAQARTEALQLTMLADAPWRSPISRDLSLWYRKGDVYPIPPPEE
ncbi:MAG: hypothetical protein ABJB49_08210 [Nitrospirota bacterium]